MEKTSFESMVEMDLILLSKQANQVLSKGEMLTAICRHACGDWGDLSLTTHVTNDDNLEHGLPVVSRFEIRQGEAIWMETDPEDNSTVIMLESELQ